MIVLDARQTPKRVITASCSPSYGIFFTNDACAKSNRLLIRDSHYIIRPQGVNSIIWPLLNPAIKRSTLVRGPGISFSDLDMCRCNSDVYHDDGKPLFRFDRDESAGLSGAQGIAFFRAAVFPAPDSSGW